jgi:acyl-CoA reductase-like NAD-dependent aldehyde dehydrogenase
VSSVLIATPGPIVPLLSWSSEDEIIARANDSKMALGASVWSNDLSHAAHVADRLEAGSLWVNDHMNISALAPFGGHKESGIGYERCIGGLEGYCNVKTLYLRKRRD